MPAKRSSGGRSRAKGKKPGALPKTKQSRAGSSAGGKKSKRGPNKKKK